MDVDPPAPRAGPSTSGSGHDLAYFPVGNTVQGRSLASISGTDNLVGLFGLEPTYARFVRPYEIDNDVRRPAAVQNGHPAVDNVARPRPPRDYGAMLEGLMGTHDYSKDLYLQQLVSNPDDPMPPAGLRKFDNSTLRDAFTLQIGTLDGFEHSEWTRTDMPVQHVDQAKAIKRERRQKRKAEVSANGSATNTPSATPQAKRRKVEA